MISILIILLERGDFMYERPIIMEESNEELVCRLFARLFI